MERRCLAKNSFRTKRLRNRHGETEIIRVSEIKFLCPRSPYVVESTLLPAGFFDDFTERGDCYTAEFTRHYVKRKIGTMAPACYWISQKRVALFERERERERKVTIQDNYYLALLLWNRKRTGRLRNILFYLPLENFWREIPRIPVSYFVSVRPFLFLW